MKFCPVCMLRQAFGGEGESPEPALERAVEPKLQPVARCLEHYELVTDDDVLLHEMAISRRIVDDHQRVS